MCKFKDVLPGEYFHSEGIFHVKVIGIGHNAICLDNEDNDKEFGLIYTRCAFHDNCEVSLTGHSNHLKLER